MSENRSLDIIEIIAEVVKKVSENTKLTADYGLGGKAEVDCPEINYIFGNSQYFKDSLDEMNQTPQGREMKFPVIALLCPVVEHRNDPNYYSKATVEMLIACGTDKEYSNAQRLYTSFKNVLRPIYVGFMRALREDGRFDFGYEPLVRHGYSENYSYGRYGALTPAGEVVSEPIDAINITNLELKVKLPNCK